MDTASSRTNLISNKTMGKARERAKEPSVLSPFTWCFFGSDCEGDDSRSSSKALTGEEATMVAATKHFSLKSQTALKASSRSMDTASSRTNLINNKTMGKARERAKEPSVLSPFTWCFFGSDCEGDDSRSSSKALTGEEATMVAATKHFSSAHKVRLG